MYVNCSIKINETSRLICFEMNPHLLYLFSCKTGFTLPEVPQMCKAAVYNYAGLLARFSSSKTVLKV